MTSPVADESLNKVDEWKARPAPPCAMVIFGATGDLTKRKLIPALYNLVNDELLPDEFAVVGIGRSPLSEKEFRQRMAEDLRQFATVEVDEAKLDWLLERLRYVAGDLENPETFRRLGEALAKVDAELGTAGNYLYSLAVPPSLFCEYIFRLGEAGLIREEEGKWRRGIIEKPFGHDLDSPRKLNRDIRDILAESQIFRIDH